MLYHDFQHSLEESVIMVTHSLYDMVRMAVMFGQLQCRCIHITLITLKIGYRWMDTVTLAVNMQLMYAMLMNSKFLIS
jgi:hypothetical protein